MSGATKLPPEHREGPKASLGLERKMKALSRAPKTVSKDRERIRINLLLQFKNRNLGETGGHLARYRLLGQQSFRL